MSSEGDRRAALEQLEGIADRGGDADDVLRASLEVLAGLLGGAAIGFVEEGRLVPGPAVGERGGEPARTPVVFGGMTVGELETPASAADAAFLERAAGVLAPWCLVGWDTGGEAWEP